MAFHAIRAGEGDAFLCGGVEAVSRYVNGNSDRLPDTKNLRFTPAAARLDGDTAWKSARDIGELPDVYVAMGETAENVAAINGVSRDEQDAFALRSQRLYQEALDTGFWANEITPVRLPNGETFSADESPRATTSAEGLAKLDPVFREGGTVTAGNACPLARIRATGVSALDPELMGLGPVEATRSALRNAGMTIDDVDLVEMNEAFAAQVIPSYGELGIDIDRLNVHGGAIALGHPFGMTGIRMTATLLNGLRARDKSIGLVTMCVAGGQGMGLIVERLA
jgi:acetyl-CoA C-acetyltransferase